MGQGRLAGALLFRGQQAATAGSDGCSMAGEPLAGLWILAALPFDPGFWGEAVLPLLPAQLAAGHHTLSHQPWMVVDSSDLQGCLWPGYIYMLLFKSKAVFKIIPFSPLLFSFRLKDTLPLQLIRRKKEGMRCSGSSLLLVLWQDPSTKLWVLVTSQRAWGKPVLPSRSSCFPCPTPG